MNRPRMRRYFLWDTVQPRFVTLSLWYLMIVIAAVSAALFLPLMLRLDTSAASPHDTLTTADLFLLLHSRFWPVVAVVVIALTIHGVFFSHRIAGPLYRFRHIFREVGHGDLSVRTTIRKGDYLHPEAECLRVMVAALREKIDGIEACHHEQRHLLARAQQAVTRGSMRDVQALIDQLEQGGRKMTQAIDSFRRPAERSAPDPSSLPKASGL